MPPETSERRADLKSNLLERLHDPFQLRIFVMAGVFLIGYVAVYMPLNEQISMLSNKINSSQKMLALAKSMDQLQKLHHTFEGRVPKRVDDNEWMQYIVKGIQQFPQMNILALDFEPPTKLGPYQVVSLKMKLEGSFLDLNKFLVWIESNPQLLRADQVKLSVPKSGDPGMLGIQIQVTGLSS